MVSASGRNQTIDAEQKAKEKGAATMLIAERFELPRPEPTGRQLATITTRSATIVSTTLGNVAAGIELRRTYHTIVVTAR